MIKKLSDKTQGIVYVGFCIFLWSILACFAKFGQEKLDNHQYLFFSSIASFLTLLSITIYNKRIKEFSTYSGKTIIWLSILGFFNYLYYLLLYLGYKKANGMEVLVVQYTWPIFIVILSIFLLKEKLNLNKSISLLLGFSGVLVIITKGDFEHINLSNIQVILLVMLGSLSFALFSVLSKNITITSLNAITIYFFTAAVYSFISMIILSELTLPTMTEWISILVNGILINGVSYIFWIKALQKTDASFIAPFVFITPVLSTLQLTIFFDDPFLMIYLLGLALIIASGILNNLKTKKVKTKG